MSGKNRGIVAASGSNSNLVEGWNWSRDFFLDTPHNNFDIGFHPNTTKIDVQFSGDGCPTKLQSADWNTVRAFCFHA